VGRNDERKDEQRHEQGGSATCITMRRDVRLVCGNLAGSTTGRCRKWVLLISGATGAGTRPRAPPMLRRSKIGETAFARIYSDAGAQRLRRRASREPPTKRRVCGGAGGARKAGKLVGEQPSATGAGWGELKQRRAAP